MSSVKSLIKWLYNSVPLKHLLFRPLRYLKLPEKIWEHLYFSGRIRIFLDPLTSVVMEARGSISENQLFWTGVDGWYERTSVRLWLKMSTEAAVIVDAGANSGFYSLAAAAVNPSARIIAFEPVPETYEWLKRNIDMNCDMAVVAESFALSFTSGSARIWIEALGNHYTPSLSKESRAYGARHIEVQTTTLDDYFQKKKIDRLDLVKIDVERHEPEVLSGMEGLLWRFRPSILLEVLDDETGARIEQKLAGLGYLYFNINEGAGIIRLVDRISRSDTLNYLLIQPGSARALDLI